MKPKHFAVFVTVLCPQLAVADDLYLSSYVYSETPTPKPAEILHETLKEIPIGNPLDEIQLASAAFDLDDNLMKAVAKVESDFDPNNRTGKYIGLFQLSREEFAKYGSGDILNVRDNAVAAAAKMSAEGKQFEMETHQPATAPDLYLIHQQGKQGAEEHLSHPERPAWQSMCATDEGKQKGESWCKKAVWGNTLPKVKEKVKTVDNFTSGDFVQMWQERLNQFIGAIFSVFIPPHKKVEVEPHKHKKAVKHRHRKNSS
jgi:hypothetical protein